MDLDSAQRSARRVGVITLPLGLVLLAAPDRAGRMLGLGEHPTALRTIGVLDLAVATGLLVDGGRWQWLTTRAGLNLGIAAYSLRLALREGATSAWVAVAAMLAATAADAPAILVLHRSAER